MEVAPPPRMAATCTTRSTVRVSGPPTSGRTAHTPGLAGADHAWILRATVGRGGLFSGTAGPGAAGAVVVHAGRISMREEATIARNTHGVGPGGSVSINATSLEVDQGFIQAQAAETRVGDAGTIAMGAGRVTLTGGARINSITWGAGRGGSITVTTTDAVAISGSTSGLFTNTAGQGLGGDIAVQARQIQR